MNTRTMWLPQLREPLGWRSLSDAELGARVMFMLNALQEGPLRRQDLAASEPGPSGLELRGRDECSATQTSAALPSSSGIQEEQIKRWGRIGLGLPWLAVAIGLAMALPVLIWAPLVGGLCLGLVGIQAGMVRRWARRHAASPARTAQDDSVHAVVVSSPARPQTSGWLLAAFLALSVLLAAVLLATLHIKSREPAAAANALHLKRQVDQNQARDPLGLVSGSSEAPAGENEAAPIGRNDPPSNVPPEASVQLNSARKP